MISLNHKDTGPKQEEVKKSEDHRSETQTLTSEEMGTIGFMAAGMAHEINNPLGFTRSNLSTARKYLQEMCNYVEGFKRFVCQVDDPECLIKLPPHLRQYLEELRDPESVADADFLFQDFADILQESTEGVDRIRRFVDDVTYFARPGEPEVQWVDINRCLASTTSLVRHEIERKARLTEKYGQLDQIKCFPRQLNAMFMRLMLFIAESIESQGHIQIATRSHQKVVLITISICGQRIREEQFGGRLEPLSIIPENHHDTEPGMRIIYDAIQMHKGKIDVLNRSEERAYFSVMLPYENGL